MQPNRQMHAPFNYSPSFISTLIILENLLFEVEERSSISLWTFRFDSGVEEKHVLAAFSMLTKES